jgi:hypothetical protein
VAIVATRDGDKIHAPLDFGICRRGGGGLEHGDRKREGP